MSRSASPRLLSQIGVAIEQGQIDHTPALFVIGPDGRLARLYLTQQSYAAVPQLGQLLAQEASDLLPDHPRVNSHLSYAQRPAVAPSTSTSDRNLPIWRGGKFTTPATWRPISDSGV